MILILALLFNSHQSFAAAVPDPSEYELMQYKTQYEKKLAERYRALAGTLLNENSFEVGAEVTLKKLPNRAPAATEETKTFKKAPPSDTFVPGDLSMNLIETDRIIEDYQDEIERLKHNSVTAGTPAAWEKNYGLGSVTVLLGLKNTVDAQHKNEVEKWVKDRLANDYGSTGKVVISDMFGAVSSTKDVYEKIAGIQNLIGFLIAALTLLLSMIFWKKISSKDANEERRFKINMTPLNANLSSAPSKSEPEAEREPVRSKESQLEDEAKVRRIRDYHKSIRRFAAIMGEKMNTILLNWIESGPDGSMKAAIFLDLLVEEDHGSDMELLSKYRLPREMSQVFVSALRVVRRMEIPLKLEKLEEIYIDLLAGDVLDANSIKQPFQFFNNASGKAAHDFLKDKTADTRAMVMLHMPAEARQGFISSLDNRTRVELFKEVFSVDTRLSHDELLQMNDDLKSQFSGKLGSQSSMLKVLASVIETLNPIDEIGILSGLATSMKDSSLFAEFKQTYPTLSFVPEWPENVRKTLFESAEFEQLSALIRALPECEPFVLAVASPMTQRMLDGLLRTEDTTPQEEKNKHLTALKDKLKTLVNAGLIQLSSLSGQPVANNVTPITTTTEATDKKAA